MSNKLHFTIIGKDEFSGAFDKLKTSLPSVKTAALATGAAFVAMGTALYAATVSTAKAHDEIQKLSDKLGTSTEFLSQMAVAAEFSGVKVGVFNQGISQLQIGIGDAAQGIGTGKEAFERLSLSIHDTTGKLKTSEEMLPELADAFNGLTSATEKSELASKLFGTRGTALLQMFTKGSKGLKEMSAEADRFGVTVSGSAGRAAAGFNDSLYRMDMALTGVKNALAEKVMPTLTALQNWFADFIADNRTEIAGMAETFIKAMGWIAEKGLYAVAVLVDSFRGLEMIYKILQIGFDEFSLALVKGIQFITGKIVTLLETLNFKGIFDGAIAGAKAFERANINMAAAILETQQATKDELDAIIDEDATISKVKRITEGVKAAVADMKASIAGGGEGRDDDKEEEESIGTGTGMVPLLEREIEQLQAMYDEYRLSEMEKLDAWYAQQRDIFQGHNKQLSQLSELYQEKKREIIDEDMEAAIEQMELAQELADEDYELKLEKLDIWYEKQQLAFADNEEALAKLNKIYTKKKVKVQSSQDNDEKKKKEEFYKMLGDSARRFQTNSLQLMEVFGIKNKAIAKSMSMAMVLISGAEAFVNALATKPFIPAGLAAAAVAAVEVGGQMAIIASAHGGLDYVPSEATYLLNEGERVLAPRQNTDLTTFLEKAGEESVAGTIEGGINISILENATNADSLLSMDRRDWEDICSEQIIPAMQTLVTQGITI